jgi:hypothetical protein
MLQALNPKNERQLRPDLSRPQGFLNVSPRFNGIKHPTVRR